MKDQYDLLLGQVNNLSERRQSVTTTYLSVNAALTGAMAFLFKDGQLVSPLSQIAALTLLFSGAIACSLWRRLITQYSTLIDWWYTQLRTLETSLPTEEARLITREYQELYNKQSNKKKSVGITTYETQLTWLFTIIYAAFAIAIGITLLLPH